MFWSRRSSHQPNGPEHFFADRAAFTVYARLWDDITQVDSAGSAGILQRHANQATMITHIPNPEDIPHALATTTTLKHDTYTKLGLTSLRYEPLQIQLCAESSSDKTDTHGLFRRVVLAQTNPVRGIIAEYELTPTSLVQTVGRMRRRSTRITEDTIRQLRIDLELQQWQPLEPESDMFYR